MRVFFKQLKMFCFLSAVWLCLSGVFHLHMLLNMLATNVVIVVVLHKMDILPNIRVSFSGFRYILLMLKNMFLSSVNVLHLIGRDKVRFSSDIRLVCFKNLKSDIGTVMQAAAITMTPGTAVLAIDDKNHSMIVHALDDSLFNSMPDADVDNLVYGSKVTKLIAVRGRSVSNSSSSRRSAKK